MKPNPTQSLVKKKTILKNIVCYHYPAIDSTNLEAERFAKNQSEEKLQHLQEGVVFIADTQSNGQGSFHKTWESQMGGLYYSLLLPYDGSAYATDTELITSLGHKISYLVYQLSNAPIDHKLPNDLLIGYRKIGGILLRSFKVHQHPYLIIGIGINLNQTQFPDSVRSIATSLYLHTQKIQSRKIYIEQITKTIKEMLQSKVPNPSSNPSL